jgi:two-component system sensor histidine kinase PilS (NtrC family)
MGDQALVLRASQARVIPRISELPGTPSAGYLIFLEDTGIVSRRANAMTIESLAELSSSIAHEIRNPLAALKNAAELLGESADISAGDKRLTEIINAQSMRMNDIVENILQLARREQSRPDRFEINQWLRAFSEELSDSNLGHKLQLLMDLSKTPVHIWFDRSQLHQVVWKLLENAAVHAVVDDIPPKVTVQVNSLGSSPHCVLDVRDNGPGIHEDNLAHIFEPFFSTHPKGSGLGLYIAKQLCEANLSELTVESIAGRGTRFRLRIPTVQSQSLAQALEPLLDRSELEEYRS